MPITAAQLKAAVPRVDVARWLVPINAAMNEFGIESPARMAGFLGQCGHESADFTRLVENLNYSADGLANTWRTRYSNGKQARLVPGGSMRWLPNDLANKLARRPEPIANSVYSGRMGNGNEASGDGWRYRGRGIVQLTGKDNYRAASDALGVDYVGEPELLEEPLHAARVAAWWFKENRALGLCDSSNWLGLSRCVNLGNAASTAMPHGHEDRLSRITGALAALA